LGELGAAGAQDADEICADFEKTESKKHRLFDTYLSERRAFMMAADYTHSIKLYGQLPVFTSAGRSLAQLYRLKVSAQLKEEIDGLLPPYLQALTDAMGRVEQGVKSTSDDTILLNDEVELDWLRTMLTEAVHAMSVIFQLADKLGDEFASWNCVSQWFGMMEKYNFFDQLQPVRFNSVLRFQDLVLTSVDS
jgi:nuclear pore complex protein Nup188